jgi:hypothetical protein
MTTVPITLQLSDTLVEQAQRMGHLTHQGLEVVLSDALESIGLTWNAWSAESLPKPMTSGRSETIESLSDTEVLALAKSKMSPAQHQRLGELQAQGKASGLSEAEHYELLALLQIYQLGLLRKAAAIEAAHLRQLPLALES